MSIPIRTYDEHRAALREIEHLWGAEEGTPEGIRLNEFVALAEAYQNERWAIGSRIPNDETRQAMTEGRALLQARRNRP